MLHAGRKGDDELTPAPLETAMQPRCHPLKSGAELDRRLHLGPLDGSCRRHGTPAHPGTRPPPAEAVNERRRREGTASRSPQTRRTGPARLPPLRVRRPVSLFFFFHEDRDPYFSLCNSHPRKISLKAVRLQNRHAFFHFFSWLSVP